MFPKHSLVLAIIAGWLALFISAVPAPAATPAFAISSPQNGALITGDSFDLAWTCDPAEVGYAVAIMLDNNIIMSYMENGADNHLTIPVPPSKAGMEHTLTLCSYWKSTVVGNYISGPYYASIKVKFKDSIGFLEPTVADGQSGETFTITWRGHPEYTGTSLSFELYRNGSFVQSLGAYYYFTGTSGSYTCPMPHVEPGANYTVRVAGLNSTQAYSNTFTLNSDPYIQVLSPTTGMYWESGTHHVLWTCLPEHFGTAARVELWLDGRFYSVLGYKWDCTHDNDLEVAQPAAETSIYSPQTHWYTIKVISFWQESHPHPGIPDSDSSEQFGIVSQPLSRIVDPSPSATWAPESNGKYRLTYESTPEVMGTAVRFDLWKGDKFFKTMGNNWNNQTINTVLLDDPRVSSGSDYYIRVVSYWLESHPTPGVPTYVETLKPITINSSLPLYIKSAHTDVDGTSEWLQLQWHSEWQTVGTVFNIELWPKNPRSGKEYYLVNAAHTFATDHIESYLVPIMNTTETQYYVRISSAWQQQIQGPYQRTESSFMVTIPHPWQ